MKLVIKHSLVFAFLFLRYSIFSVLRLSFILFCYGPLSLGLKFDEDPISRCWEKQGLKFSTGRSAGGGWISKIVMSLCGPIMQAETFQIVSWNEISR